MTVEHVAGAISRGMGVGFGKFGGFGAQFQYSVQARATGQVLDGQVLRSAILSFGFEVPIGFS